MKLFVRTIMVWFLSLSLACLPLVAQSHVLRGMSSADTMSGNPHKTATSAKAMDVPCHVKTEKTGQVETVADVGAGAKKTHDCCCSDCKCSHDSSCQSAVHFSAAAILTPLLIVVPVLSSNIITESALLYHDHDREPDIIPPVV